MSSPASQGGVVWLPVCLSLLALPQNAATIEGTFSKHVEVWCYSLEAKRICCDPNRLLFTAPHPPPPTSTRGITSSQHDTTLTASWCQQASVSHGGGSGSRRGMLVRGGKKAFMSSPQLSPACPWLITVSVLHQSVESVSEYERICTCWCGSVGETEKSSNATLVIYRPTADFCVNRNQLQCYACVQLIQALIFCAFFVEALCEM